MITDDDKGCEYKVGDTVKVTSKEGNISKLKNSGTLVAIMPPYCKVSIAYGRQRGMWYGLLSELNPGRRRKTEEGS